MASQKPWELFVSLFCSLLFEVPKLRLIILSLWQQGCTLHTLEGSMRAHHGVRVQSLLVSCLKDCCGQRASLLFGTGPGQAPSSAVLSLFLKSTPQNKTSKQQQQKPNNNPTEAKKKKTHARKKKKDIHSMGDPGTSILEHKLSILEQAKSQTDNTTHPRRMTVLFFIPLCKLKWKI